MWVRGIIVLSFSIPLTDIPLTALALHRSLFVLLSARICAFEGSRAK
jgi:hypothetical protein